MSAGAKSFVVAPHKIAGDIVWAEIDADIRCLVQRFNALGLVTRACCSGHCGLLVCSNAYVMFDVSAPQRMLQIMQGLLTEMYCGGAPALNFYWWVEGRFDEKNQLVFVLRQNINEPTFMQRLQYRSLSLADFTVLEKLAQKSHDLFWAEVAGGKQFECSKNNN